MTEVWPSERWQTPSYTSCESEELYLTSCGTYDLGIVPTLASLNDGETPRLSFSLFPASSVCISASCRVSIPAEPAEPRATGATANAQVVLHAKYIHLGCADKSVLKAAGNTCIVKSLLFLKSLLVFHLAAAPGHRMRQRYKQRASRDIRYSLSPFLCCSWCVSSYSVLQHFSD